MTSKVDVVIVNWNSGELLVKAVESVSTNASSLVGKIIVVDNASNDASLRGLEIYPNVIVVPQDCNLGFGKASNIGAKLSDAEYILFFNPDASLGAGVLKDVLDFMDNPKNSLIHVCGIALRDECGRVSRSCSRIPTPRSMFFHIIGVDRFFPSLGFVMAEWAHDCNRFVDHVIGAFYFIRRSVFVELGGFDERFFVYLEDLDLSKKISENGGLVYFFASAVSDHVGGGSSRKIKATRLYYAIRSRLQYMFKNFGFFAFILLSVLSLLIEPLIRVLYGLLSLSYSAIKETVLAYAKLYSWILRDAILSRIR